MIVPSTSNCQTSTIESSNSSMSTLNFNTTQSECDKSDNEFMDDDPALDNIFNGIDVNSVTQTYVLAEKFGVTHFRDFQKKAVEASLDGNDTFIIQPTSTGKSLCYQFPAVYTGKTTLVITPTISLMQDQTLELNSKGIKATFLGSAQSDPLAETKAFDFANPAPIIYVSPEWLF